jgi:hypothetical protein
MAIDPFAIGFEVVGYALGVDPAGAVRTGVPVAVMGKAHSFNVHTTSSFSEYLLSPLTAVRARR